MTEIVIKKSEIYKEKVKRLKIVYTIYDYRKRQPVPTGSFEIARNPNEIYRKGAKTDLSGKRVRKCKNVYVIVPECVFVCLRK